MIRVAVRDVAAGAELGDRDHGNAGSVAEKVERLNIARVPISAAFVEGDQDGGVGPQFWIGLHAVDDLLHKAFEEIELRRRRMAVNPAARLDIGDGRQLSTLDTSVQIGGILEVRRPHCGIGHDRGRILLEIADIAIFVGPVVISELIRIFEIGIPLIAVIGPGHALVDQRVADGAHVRRRDRVDIIVLIGIRIGVAAVAEVTWIVVVDKIVMTLLAIGIDLVGERLEVVPHG